MSAPPHVRHEVVALARLAVPLIFARLGQTLLYVVDTVVAGSISPEAVAALGSIGAAYLVVFSAAFGVLLGLDPLVSNAVGRGDPAEARAGLATARRLALALAGLVACAVLALPAVLRAFNQPEEVVSLLEGYVPFLAAMAFPALLFHVDATFLTAHGHTRPLIGIVVVANLTNLALDLWLAHGGLGVPALGVAGIGAASFGCALAEFGAMRWVLRRAGTFGGLGHDLPPFDRPAARRILRTGGPVGFQYALETSGFLVVTLLVGLKGTTALAGHQIAMNFAGIVFAIALGLGGAAGVRVGQARGRRDRPALRLSGACGFGLGAGAGLAFAVVAWFGRDAIAALYADDPVTAAMAARFLAVAAVWQVADATQASGFGILRGLDDTRVPVTFNLVGYAGLGLPFGYWLAFVATDDPVGLWWGLSVSLAAVAVALVVRFERLTRTDRCLDPRSLPAGPAPP